MFHSPVYLSPHISIALCESILFCYPWFLFRIQYIPVSWLLIPVCLVWFLGFVSWCPVYFCKSCYLFFPSFSVTPSPCSIQSMCVSFGLFHVKCYSDFPASTLICVLADSVPGSPLPSPQPDLPWFWPLPVYDSLFHSHFPVHLGPSPHIPFTVPNREYILVMWLYLFRVIS